MAEPTEPRGQLSVRIVAMPADTNANGDIFGGWLVSIMDLAGGCESKRRAQSRTVTVAIDKMTFLKPVSVGDIVCCYTDLIKEGRTSMQFYIEVWKLNLKQTDRVKVADGVFTFVAIDDTGNPHPIDR